MELHVYVFITKPKKYRKQQKKKLSTTYQERGQSDDPLMVINDRFSKPCYLPIVTTTFYSYVR